MYQLHYTSAFKKSLKKIKKRNREFSSTRDILFILQNNGVEGIPKHMNPHKLKGEYKDNWECHIKPDLLIIWFQIEKPKQITLINIGSHSDLFK